MEKDLQEFFDWLDGKIELEEIPCKVEHLPYGDLITHHDGSQDYISSLDTH